MYVLMIAVPVVLLGLSIPLIRGRVGPNFLYGVRTRKTLSSPEIWYKANRLGGIYLTVATLAALGVWGVLALCRMPITLWVPVCLNVLVAFCGIACIAIVVQVRKM